MIFSTNEYQATSILIIFSYATTKEQPLISLHPELEVTPANSIIGNLCLIKASTPSPNSVHKQVPCTQTHIAVSIDNSALSAVIITQIYINQRSSSLPADITNIVECEFQCKGRQCPYTMYVGSPVQWRSQDFFIGGEGRAGTRGTKH